MSDQTPLFGIEPIELQEEMEQSFLVYALAMITQRALPDVRDGLKPVHRRILYDMFEQGFRPDRPHVKCARVTGDVMAKYHPHGNKAIYDALVRMAQPFSLRHPLIDFHGNYGSPDFEAAAERYCVTGDTLVATPGGDVPIATLAGSPIASDSELDIAVKVLDKFGDPVLATKLFHSGSHPTLRLSTASGQTITGTGNHPLLCLVPVAGVPLLLWKLLEEIRPGDVVVTVQENPYMRYFCTLVDDFAAGERAAGIAGDEIAAAVEPLEAFGYATVESVEPAGVQPVYSTATRSSPTASSTTTRSAGWRPWPCSSWPGSTRRPSTSPTTTRASSASRWCCPPASPTCWSTAARASRWPWPPTSRPTTWPR
jgi:hypothetical protein